LIKLRNTIAKIINYVNYIAMAACFACVFVVAIDVILRKVSGQRLSITGSNEISTFLLLVMCMLSIPMLQIKKGHVWVNMFVDMFPSKMRSIWLGIILLLETFLCIAFCYGCIAYGSAVAVRTSDLLKLPWRPFAYVSAFGFLEFAVILIVDTIQCFVDACHGGEAKNADE